LREDSVRIGANRSHHTDNDDQDNGQHDRVFGYVLTIYVVPNALKKQTNTWAHSVGQYAAMDSQKK
jgi:hypothetical protein